MYAVACNLHRRGDILPILPGDLKAQTLLRRRTLGITGSSDTLRLMYHKAAVCIPKAQDQLSLTVFHPVKQRALRIRYLPKAVCKLQRLRAHALTDLPLHLRMNIIVDTLIDDAGHGSILHGVIYPVLRLPDQAPVLEIRVLLIAVHRKLGKDKRKPVISPVLAPLRDHPRKELPVQMRQMVVALSLIVQKALQRIRHHALQHTLIQSARTERVAASHRPRPFAFADALQYLRPFYLGVLRIARLGFLVKFCLIDDIFVILPALLLLGLSRHGSVVGVEINLQLHILSDCLPRHPRGCRRSAPVTADDSDRHTKLLLEPHRKEIADCRPVPCPIAAEAFPATLSFRPEEVLIHIRLLLGIIKADLIVRRTIQGVTLRAVLQLILHI